MFSSHVRRKLHPEKYGFEPLAYTLWANIQRSSLLQYFTNVQYLTRQALCNTGVCELDIQNNNSAFNSHLLANLVFWRALNALFLLLVLVAPVCGGATKLDLRQEFSPVPLSHKFAGWLLVQRFSTRFINEFFSKRPALLPADWIYFFYRLLPMWVEDLCNNIDTPRLQTQWLFSNPVCKVESQGQLLFLENWFDWLKLLLSTALASSLILP